MKLNIGCKNNFWYPNFFPHIHIHIKLYKVPISVLVTISRWIWIFIAIFYLHLDKFTYILIHLHPICQSSTVDGHALKINEVLKHSDICWNEKMYSC